MKAQWQVTTLRVDQIFIVHRIKGNSLTCMGASMLGRGYPERFATEWAVLSRLQDYARMLGLLDCFVQLGGGKGGLVERSPVPEEWMGDA